jgi:predicted RNA-binding Zn-ribbon protein involved in translation (DUF1610 family)
MGTALTASCQCGYEKGTSVGGTMRNFMTVCHAPALCRDCKELVTLNYLAGEHSCPNCGKEVAFYNHESLRRKNAAYDLVNAVVDDKNFKLSDIKYRCPRCGKLSLKFRVWGHFD